MVIPSSSDFSKSEKESNESSPGTSGTREGVDMNSYICQCLRGGDDPSVEFPLCKRALVDLRVFRLLLRSSKEQYLGEVCTSWELE